MEPSDEVGLKPPGDFLGDMGDEDVFEMEKDCLTSYKKPVMQLSPWVEASFCDRKVSFLTKTLLIACDYVTCSFLDQYFIKDSLQHSCNDARCTLVGGLFHGGGKVSKITLNRVLNGEPNCFIYQLKSNNQLFLVKCYSSIEERALHDWVQQLMEIFDLTEGDVWIFATDSNRIYINGPHDPEDIPTPFLRLLDSKGHSEKGSFPPSLDVPNLVYGLPAALMGYCYKRGLSAKLYVAYEERTTGHNTNFVDSDVLYLFKRVIDGHAQLKRCTIGERKLCGEGLWDDKRNDNLYV